MFFILCEEFEKNNFFMSYSKTDEYKFYIFHTQTFLRVQVGIEHFYYKLILFNRLLYYMPDAIYSLAKFKVVFEIYGV